MLKVFTSLADWLAYGIMGLEEGSKLGSAAHFYIEDSVKIFFLLFIMIFIVSFLRSNLKARRIKEIVMERRHLTGYVLAALLGAVTPFCSCSSIPIFLGFVTAGIPLGVTMSFLVASPCINEASVIMFYDALGSGLTVLYVGMGLLAGVLGGFLFDALFKFKPLAVSGQDSSCSCGCNAGSGETVAGIKERLKVAFKETRQIISSIWLWVMGGLLLGAYLHGYVPEDFIARYLGGKSFWCVPLAVLVGIPTYANVTSVVPVAAELVRKGLPPGTALSFLLSTAAVSLPELFMLKRVMPMRMLMAFVAYLLAYFSICGIVINILAN